MAIFTDFMHKGHKMSAQHKLAISRACMGRPSPMKGRKLSKATKLKMRLARLGKPSPNWQGGGMNWLRRKVLERDQNTCASCKTRKGNMEIDHILPRKKFPELKLDINNIQTLCEECHKLKTKEDIKKFYPSALQFSL